MTPSNTCTKMKDMESSGYGNLTLTVVTNTGVENHTEQLKFTMVLYYQMLLVFTLIRGMCVTGGFGRGIGPMSMFAVNNITEGLCVCVGTVAQLLNKI